jgi:hypothetical protein
MAPTVVVATSATATASRRRIAYRLEPAVEFVQPLEAR